MLGSIVAAYYYFPLAQAIGFYGQAAAPFYGCASLGFILSFTNLKFYRDERKYVTKIYLLKTLSVVRIYTRDGNREDIPISSISET